MVRHLVGKTLVMVFIFANALSAAEFPQAILDVDGRQNPRLGLAFPGSHPTYFAKLAEAGMTVARIEASWAHIEPRPGKFDFNGLDSRIKGLQQAGLSPFVTFASDAEWATVPGTRHLKNATPADLSAWSGFVQTVVERYDLDGVADMPGLKAPVRYYQAANEFMGANNVNGGWAGSNDALLAYVNSAHDAVKAADKRAVFVLGGLSVFSIDAALLASGAEISLQQERGKGEIRTYTEADFAALGWNDLFENRLKRVLKHARYDFADVHLYGPESRDDMRIALARRLSGRPVLSSECGGPSLAYGGRYSGHGHYVAVMERNLNALASGMPFCLWFGLGEEINTTYANSRVQLYDKNRRAKPGVAAYRLLSRLVPAKPRIERLGQRRLFRIGQAEGADTFVAFDRRAQSALRDMLGANTRVLCVNDAAGRNVVTAKLSEVERLCRDEAVVISGAVAFDLISGK